MGFGDDLDARSDAEIRGLLGEFRAWESRQVPGLGKRVKKIRNRPRTKKKYAWESLDGVGLNQTVKVTIELPSYLVAGMAEFGSGGYRTAVQEYLVRRGKTWWQPRFVFALRAKQIEAAKRQNEARDRFTTQS